MMTREEVAEIMNYCKEHKVTHKCLVLEKVDRFDAYKLKKSMKQKVSRKRVAFRDPVTGENPISGQTKYPAAMTIWKKCLLSWNFSKEE